MKVTQFSVSFAYIKVVYIYCGQKSLKDRPPKWRLCYVKLKIPLSIFLEKESNIYSQINCIIKIKETS